MSTSSLPKRPADSGAQFCPPQHHNTEGPTDPKTTTLPPNFTVLIAGGSRGIGLGIARSYALAGVANLIISSRTLSSCEDAARSIIQLNPRVKVLCQECDVTSSEQIQNLFEAVKKGFGRLDVLVINAGSSTALTEVREGGLKDWPRGMIEGPSTELERLWKINVNAPFLLQHHFLPLLEETKDGAQAVIQIGSAAAHYIDPEIMATSYSLTKFAATRQIEHVHEGHNKNGIVAYCIQPGGVKTDLSDGVPEGKGWEKLLIDSPNLCGGFCIWLTKEKRQWLSGRYLDARWDIPTLLSKREEILNKDLLKLRMALN
ncbi:hypothetical protein E2P81_ATG05765 [Venturia nashicola]|uniref:NAD(P)-binding protein n=1 Tax=Venturia nashicola TaxID=86259 RepID=A0A4Z1P979_9PEZI|nr:hypothetical protein E6O75_ATG05910 [Venturia nashicola]TLD29471.1 hypothetical protein E2P81_ATG05765 [Venturia nashicola]